MALLRRCNYEEDMMCKVCGRTVHQEQWKGENPSGKEGFFWLPVEHVGMCGKICIGGWTDLDKVVTNLIHNYDCVDCAVAK